MRCVGIAMAIGQKPNGHNTKLPRPAQWFLTRPLRGDVRFEAVLSTA